MKFIKFLFKLCVFLCVAAIGFCVWFYVSRKEHFTSVNDYFEELTGFLSELPMVALLF